MNFCSGGVVEGTLSTTAPSAAPPAAEGPPRPAGIPEHYVFDTEVELWMHPSAISKAKEAANKAASLSSNPELTVISSTVNPNSSEFLSGSVSSGVSSHEGKPGDPICFEFINSGACGRLQRGEACRYRHLEPTHPDVVADRVRQGKLPPAALDAAQRGDLAALRQIMAQPSGAAGTSAIGALAAAVPAAPAQPPVQSLLPGQTEEDLPDPGPIASLCFDYINNMQCTRLRMCACARARVLAY